jgi:hypothetical protein
MIAAAIDIELSDFLNRYSAKSTASGQKAVVSIPAYIYTNKCFHIPMPALRPVPGFPYFLW